MENKSLFDVIRRHWYEAPVSVEDILRDLGISYSEELLHPDISGMIERDDDGYRVVVNKLDSSPRKRFTAAHELGHYVYHRNLIGDGVDDSRLYRSVPEGKYFNKAIKPQHETEANRFAANLLMPSHLIKELERVHKDTHSLAKALGVSVPAMRVRKGLPPYPTPGEHFDDLEESEGGDDEPYEGPRF